MEKLRPILCLCLLGVWFYLTSCVSNSVMMRHPETGDVQRCGAFGMGLNTVIAYSHYEECVKAFEELGYVQIEGKKE